MACKPGSVPAPSPESGRNDGWPFVWDARYRTPRATDPDDSAKTRLPPLPDPKVRWLAAAVPTWSCSRWGLPCRPCRQARGALLPHPFTLTDGPKRVGGLLSVALSLGSPPPAVSRHRVSVEPGLSSPRPSPVEERPSSHLVAAKIVGVATASRSEQRPLGRGRRRLFLRA